MIALWQMTLHHLWMLIAVSIILGGLLYKLLDWLAWTFGSPYIEITHIRRMK